MKSIFIVDDIKINLKVLEVLLARNGYNVISALSGKKALSLLQSTPIDLIISDIQMPEMDGFQFCRLCKLDKNLKHIPFIFYSSMKNEAETRELAQKVGALEFISKPADPDKLLKSIENILYEYSYGTPMSNVPCVVWTIDSRGKITYITKAVEKITGFPVESIKKMGKRGCLDRVHASDARRVRKAYQNLFQNSIALDIEYRFKCHDGDLIWVYEKTGIPYKKNGLLHVDGIFIDISEKKYIQACQLKSREIEVTKTFANGVFHDLENLFKGISGYIKLSTMASTASSEREHYLSNALNISDNASNLTKIFSVLSTAEKPAKKSAFFSSVVSKVTNSLLNNSGIQYQLKIPSALWSCRVDPGQMEQAVVNLIINARDAVGLEGFIEVTMENLFIDQDGLCLDTSIGPGHYIKATIRDNGHGIDGKILHHIFHPYYSTKSLGIKKGVGLSLAFSEAVILQHGGVITVHSRKDEWTAINIYLPALKPGE